LAVVEAPDSGIVGRFKPDEEIRVGFTLKSFFDWQQNLRQRFRVDFGRSTRASGERRQADGWGVSHGLIIPDFGVFWNDKDVEPLWIEKVEVRITIIKNCVKLSKG